MVVCVYIYGNYFHATGLLGQSSQFVVFQIGMSGGYLADRESCRPIEKTKLNKIIRKEFHCRAEPQFKDRSFLSTSEHVFCSQRREFFGLREMLLIAVIRIMQQITFQKNCGFF